jgi:hypothetical protein
MRVGETGDVAVVFRRASWRLVLPPGFDPSQLGLDVVDGDVGDGLLLRAELSMPKPPLRASCRPGLNKL